jgi:hypothetical protein
MTTLLLHHEDWEVATTSWTAAGKKPGVTHLCYSWSTFSGMGFFDSSTGVEKVELKIGFGAFLGLIKAGGIVDLRPYTGDGA